MNGDVAAEHTVGSPTSTHRTRRISNDAAELRVAQRTTEQRYGRCPGGKIHVAPKGNGGNFERAVFRHRVCAAGSCPAIELTKKCDFYYR